MYDVIGGTVDKPDPETMGQSSAAWRRPMPSMWGGVELDACPPRPCAGPEGLSSCTNARTRAGAGAGAVNAVHGGLGARRFANGASGPRR
jgi:hypothetical protein